jgi:hypothetical protein
MFLVGRYLASEGLTRVVAARIGTARLVAVRAVNAMLLSTLINVSVNIGVLFAAVYGLHGRLGERQLVLVVATVYAASALHAAIKLILNAWWIADLTRYLWRHGVHGPKAWLHAQVRRQVDAHFVQAGLLRRVAYRLSGAPRPSELAE